MELRNPMSWGFWSSSLANILLLLLAAINLSANHAAAAKRFQNETDRLALLEFKHQISDDPYGVLNSWNHSQHHCQWEGVTCDTQHQRVTALTLSGKSLSGSISPHIGNLSFMKFIQLGENQLHGEIPQEIGRLVRLRSLNVTRNKLSKEIPINISLCLELRVIYLLRNKLEGKIPSELGSLKKLEKLYLAANNLTGEIPSSIGNLSSLAELSLTFNSLEGNLPNEMGLLTSLTRLAVGANRLSGMIPASIYNISSLLIISTADNFFFGNLPTNLGLTLPYLQALGIAGNQFHGHIPISITNASELVILDLGDNKFEGQIPPDLGYLSRLQTLNLGGNLLGGDPAKDLGFIASLTNNSNLMILTLDNNNFGGKLPKVMANISYRLTQLGIGGNQLSGTIPEGLGNLVNLYVFDVVENFLSGVVPSDFGELQNLQYLGLGENKLSGVILPILSNITSLYHVYLSNNRFEGSISGNLGNYQSLQFLDVSQNNFNGIITPQIFSMHLSLVYLDLAHNSFTGSLPLEVGELKHLEVFNVSYNKFSGEIPRSIVECLNLEHLLMQANFFHGTIPPNLASLKSIQQLDLSNNNLTGNIPKDLEKLHFLTYLNLSYNDLEGETPNTGIFENASQISLIGNDKLCGGIPELDLPPCPVIRRKNKEKLMVIILLSTVLPIAFLVLGTLSFYFVIYQKRYRRPAGFSSVLARIDNLLRVSYHELHRATSGFSLENLIGSGSFGVVYRGKLNQHGDRLVAIKVLDLHKNGASKSFKAECRALRNIRHRNLVSVLSYCSSIDSKGQEFKALVYEFMENGNLDLWLHPEETTNETTRSRNLNLFQRLNIAIDAASALHYLHSQCQVPIVHCDIKPSNILLDNDLVAHVGDFGLARLLAKTTSSFSEQGTSSTIAVKGSIGYTPPEYGMGIEVSTQGDVYSYGILLLEMFTGKRPTDDMFLDGLDLHNYVEKALPDQVFKILDPLLVSKGDENDEMVAEDELNNDEKKMEGLNAILKIGVNCSAPLPNERIHMNEVVRKLHLIRDGFIGAKINIADLDL